MFNVWRMKMKQNKIMLFFFMVLPVSLVLRFLQLCFTIEANTGFYINETKNFGPILLILILLCALSVGFFAWLTFIRPNNPPKTTVFMSVSALVLSLSIFAESVLNNTVVVIGWQAVLLKLLSLAVIAYFVLFALSRFIKIKLPEIASSLTVLYIIIRMICDFTSISKLSLISDNIFLIFSYCALLTFFLTYTKLTCRADNDKTFKVILSSGLASVVLCFTSSIPNLLINLILKNGYYHSSLLTCVTFFLFGVFILSYVLSYFSNHNI